VNELEELQLAIQNLSPEDFAKFRAWVFELDIGRKIAIGLEKPERGELLEGEESVREIRRTGVRANPTRSR
jgi:hypothetical protein